MTTKFRQIVIDKSAFVGTKTDALCCFARGRLVILSDTLLYECATTNRQNRRSLLRKYESVVRASAQYCSMHRRFLEWEGWHCIPFPGVLADLETTKCMKCEDGFGDGILKSVVPNAQHGIRSRVANEIFAELSARAKTKVDSVVSDAAKQVKSIPNVPAKRLCLWLSHIDRMDLHEMAVESLPAGWIRVKGEFCLSPVWMTWQYLRIATVLVYEYWYSRQLGGPRDKHAEHDYADLEYVLLLSRADAIITKDKGLTELARAAFPEKHVFSSLEEVPESYRCDRL